MTSEFDFQRHDVEGTRKILDELTEMYVEVFYAPTGNPFWSAEKFLERFELHATRPHFTLITARTDGGQLVGYAYGFSRLPDPELASWRNLDTEVPEDIAEVSRAGQVFLFSELLVREPYRRQHVAKQLHDHLLTPQSDKLATLLVMKDNHPAQAAYRGWGWFKIGNMQPFPDAPNYDCLVKWL